MTISKYNFSRVNDILLQFFVLILLVYGFLAIYLWGIKTMKRLRGWAKWRELGIVINRLSTVPLTLLQLLLVSQKTPAVGTAGGVDLLRQTEFLSTCFR